jgi:hypothetical protein
MAKHSHEFVETYDGLVGFGLNRETDEKTVMYYLQKFSDDSLLEKIVTRMSVGELETVFELLSRILKTHLTESEYHRLFLKDDQP